jgi:hemolysin III
MREFTYSEELANAISHFVGVCLAITGLVLMVVFSSLNGKTTHIVSTSIFGSTMIFLYLSSTFTHWLRPGKAKELFFNLDQIAIFLLIAGTYTPVALIALRGTLGWTVFGIEWGLALTGILYRIIRPNKYETGVNLFMVILYAAMGWFFLFVIIPVSRMMTLPSIILILSGGVLYTSGILFFRLAKFKYHHLVWHLFVLAGSISHFCAVFIYLV